MVYHLLKLAHVLGAVLIGGGLIGVWLSDLRSRQVAELPAFAEAVRSIAVFYDGVVVPGALLLLASGAWMTARSYGWEFIHTPWLAGMIVLFLFEFVEGNTVTRLYFTRLRRATELALAQGRVTPEMEAMRKNAVPAFTHFLDLPLLFLIIVLGVTQPATWSLFLAGSAVAVLVATLLTLLIPRLYPWSQTGAA